MHIPDGYLSPQTCAVFGAAMVPAWVVAGRRVRKVVKNRYVPLVAIAAAYCFLVMMLNVPIPDGTSAHAVGAVLVACLLGPWAAVIAVSIALAIQALFFGDGGLLALGANCFNMALVMPFVGYGVYLLLARRTSLTSRRRPIAAGIGGYVGLNAAALCAAIQFGVQPTLFHTPDGTPLYAPFHLAQTIPAMALAHLLVAGVVEGLLTAAVIAYLQRGNLPLLRINHAAVPETDADMPPPHRLRWRWALMGLAVLVVLTPLGLLAPGGAFGESPPSELDLGKWNLSTIPKGLNKYNGFWHNALFNGYKSGSDSHPVVGYLLSALVGILVIVAVVFAFYGAVRLLRRGLKGRSQGSGRNQLEREEPEQVLT